MARFFKILRILCAAAFFTPAFFAGAQSRAEISVSPLRSVLSSRNRSALYQISNSSDRIVEVKIDWVDLWATQNGYRPATPDERTAISAARHLVVEPAFLRLEPGAQGEVTVSLKTDGAIPKAETRSHLLFSSNAARTQLRKTGGGLEVDAKLQISTPVIIRSHARTPDVAIEKVKLVRTKKGLLDTEISLLLTGPYSAIGQLKVELMPKNAGRSISQSYVTKNVAIYPDTGKRKITVPLLKGQLPTSQINISFSGTDEYSGVHFATKTFSIAGDD